MSGTKITDEIGLALWERALAIEFGLRVRCADPMAVKASSNAMFAIRKALGAERFASLVIVFPAEPTDEFWILHKEVKLED